MKNTILILALCLFSFSLESSTGLVDVSLEQSSNEGLGRYRVRHYIGQGDEYIILEFNNYQAALRHYKHGDTQDCVPPYCG